MSKSKIEFFKYLFTFHIRCIRLMSVPEDNGSDPHDTTHF